MTSHFVCIKIEIESNLDSIKYQITNHNTASIRAWLGMDMDSIRLLDSLLFFLFAHPPSSECSLWFPLRIENPFSFSAPTTVLSRPTTQNTRDLPTELLVVSPTPNPLKFSNSFPNRLCLCLHCLFPFLLNNHSTASTNQLLARCLNNFFTTHRYLGATENDCWSSEIARKRVNKPLQAMDLESSF